MSSSSTKELMSIVRDRPGAIASSSSGSMITYSPPPRSAPLTMSENATSLPVRSLTRLYRIRSDVPRSNCRKLIVWSSVALYSSTGMVTRPKLIAPLQIGLATAIALPAAVVPIIMTPTGNDAPVLAGLVCRANEPGTTSLPA
jgi:hypothetical protein